MSNLAKEFGTNRNAERDGVWCEINDSTQVKLKRAGGGNTAYENMYMEQTKSIRRRLSRGNIPLDKLREITLNCFLRTVICGWKTLVGKVWYEGIAPFELQNDKLVMADEFAEGDLLPATEENLRNLLGNLPELFEYIKEIAEESVIFNEEMLEKETGNS